MRTLELYQCWAVVCHLPNSFLSGNDESDLDFVGRLGIQVSEAFGKGFLGLTHDQDEEALILSFKHRDDAATMIATWTDMLEILFGVPGDETPSDPS